jgi:hypothetical protein
MKKFCHSLLLALPLAIFATSFKAADCEFSVSFCHSKKSLKLKQNANNQYKCNDLTLSIFEKKIVSGKEVTLTFRVPATSKNTYLLDISVSGKIPKANGYFDGHQENILNKTLTRETIFDTFPLAVVWNKNQYLAIGVAPNTIYGYLKSSASNNGKLIYSTKVVADSIKPQSVTFTILTGKPEFQWRNAVDAYQRNYISYFTPIKGMDERIYGVLGYLTSTHVTRNLEINAARFLRHTVEWTFVPWNRSGQWYIDAEDWKKGDGYYWYDKYMKSTPCTYEQYHNYETYRYKSGNRQVAMMHYILLKDTWHEVAEKYPDCLSVNEKLQHRPKSHTTSRKDNKGFTRLTFAPGSGLQKHLESELSKVAQNYEASGFSLDMANFEYNEYNKAQLKFATGRAFDNNGNIYTPVSVANIPMQQFIHTLKRNGKPMAVINNQAISEMVAHSVFYGDAVMFEGNVELAAENVLPLRLMAGKKPMSFWSEIGVHQRARAIDWPKYRRTSQGINKAYYGLSQYLLLYCLRYGATPMNWAVEYNKTKTFKQYIPLMVDLKKAAYQVIPAISGSDQLWFGRFGENTKTIFTISNPQRKAITSTLKLHRKYLGDFSPVAEYGKIANLVKDGEFYTFTCTIEPKKFIVLRDKTYKAINTAVWSKKLDIAKFFTLLDAQNPKRFSVLTSKESEVLFDYIDRYYPFVYGCRELTKNKGFSRMVFKMNPKYNTIWPLRKSNRISGKMIIVNPVKNMPILKKKLSLQEQQIAETSPAGFIKLFPKLNILWIGGKDLNAQRKALETYLDIMDWHMGL